MISKRTVHEDLLMLPSELATGQVDLWSMPLADFGAADRQRCLALLCAAERDRFDRFGAEPARTQFLAARGLLRTTLSRYAAVAPDRWSFVTNRYGRPSIDPVHGTGDLVFSVSHTDGLVACAVSRAAAVGLDAERLTGADDALEMARTVFTAPERARLARARAGERSSVFLALWTLKEAYAKARGLGVSLPFDSFWFDIDAEPPALHVTESAMEDDPRRWRFGTSRVGRDHLVAVAAAFASPDTALTLVLRQAAAIG